MFKHNRHPVARSHPFLPGSLPAGEAGFDKGSNEISPTGKPTGENGKF